MSNSSKWVLDTNLRECAVCLREFGTNKPAASNKTHCRYCGGVYCRACCYECLSVPAEDVVQAPQEGPGFDPAAPQRVCVRCAEVSLHQ
ncbi:hypothetical protein JKP88DRAFT_169114 [Tribonema minus]|uniref:FYVE-type domain-containing protein n=1 Tax=Tribonema minus TaxID=303371 RepID=A0A835YN18_9STRA|nr:hypothetical protein JKP88DRAFT_169114 [Tribonema minus]